MLSLLPLVLLLASLLEPEFELLLPELLPLFPESLPPELLLPESLLEASPPALLSEPELAEAFSLPLCLLDAGESEPLSELPLPSLPPSDLDDPEDVPLEFLRA